MEKSTQPSLFGLEDEIGIVRESIQVLFKRANHDEKDDEVVSKLVATLSKAAVTLAHMMKAHRAMGMGKEDLQGAMNDMVLLLMEEYRQEPDNTARDAGEGNSQ